MKVRQLIECTVDIANPVSELFAVINAVLTTIQDVEQRAIILRQLDEEVGAALAIYEKDSDGISE